MRTLRTIHQQAHVIVIVRVYLMVWNDELKLERATAVFHSMHRKERAHTSVHSRHRPGEHKKEAR